MKILSAICFILMIICAGSDGPYFPYLNIIGTLVFGMGFVLFIKISLLNINLEPISIAFQNPFVKPEPFPLWVWRNFFWYRRDFSMFYFIGITFRSGISIPHKDQRECEKEI